MNTSICALRSPFRRSSFLVLPFALLLFCAAGCLFTKNDPTAGFEIEMPAYANVALDCVYGPQPDARVKEATFVAGQRFVIHQKSDEPRVYSVVRASDGASVVGRLGFTQLGAHLFITARAQAAFYTYRVVPSAVGITVFELPPSEKELFKQLAEMPQAELRTALLANVDRFNLKYLDFKTVQFDQKPVLLTPVAPKYPKKLQEQNLEGRTVILVKIDAKGKVTETSVISADYPDMGKSAAEALRKAKYQPAQLAGKPVACAIEVPIRFQLK